MTDNQTHSPVKFEDLDIFDLLRLSHLTPEKKAERIAEIQMIVVNNFFLDDLPGLVSESDLKKFDELAKDASKGEELKTLLHDKVPNFDQIIYEKMLVAKKEIVLQNMQTRLDINSKEASDPEVQKDEKRMKQLSEEKDKLDKIVTAINSNDWTTVSGLINTL
ncbi:hypothetical protein A2Z22_02425 [Candidatus Woesebacteria bacterium RBG_16_34_12]|uniref:Uncharacterized protein n=1 Tax=Candidatus Woesebacteria bacterium RBG_16_34_12 TaxID=1802480 RepID=A0A1F7X9C1_9BACT|nr:MAG: hypothetical protein A2Z22_02425 [Candidatus Woesebacteria bacterium RBG_16_34_12]